MKLTIDDSFDISKYGGKLFQADPIKLGYEIDIPEVETATPEGKEAQKLVKGAWEVKMAAWKKEKEKEYKNVLALTEKALLETAKKKGPEFLKAAKGDKALASNKLMQWLSEEAKGANVMIKNALTTFEGVCKKFMVELWEKVAASIDKKFKTAIRNAKVKAVLKIIGLSIVVVAAAALTIAGAVLTALAAPTGIGAIAGLGLAAGGIVTVVGAIKQIYDIADKSYPDHKKAAKTVRDKIIALSDALDYEQKKIDKENRGEKLGPKEKIKRLLGNTKGKQKDVETALETLSMWTGKMLLSIEKGGQAEYKLADKLQELDDALKTATDPKEVAAIKKQQEDGVKQVTELFRARENARGYLGRYTAICEEATKVMQDSEKLTSSRLGVLSSKIETLMSSKEYETFMTLGKGTVEFMKGFMKFAAK